MTGSFTEKQNTFDRIVNKMVSENEKVLLLELARRVMLDRDDFDMNDEYGTALYSVWKLLNIKNYPNRKNYVSNVPCVVEKFGDICSSVPDDLHGGVRFTAHSHRGGILDQSPDDIAVYGLISDISDVNLIVDDFNCRKVEKE